MKSERQRFESLLKIILAKEAGEDFLAAAAFDAGSHFCLSVGRNIFWVKAVKKIQNGIAKFFLFLLEGVWKAEAFLKLELVRLF